MIQWHHRLNGHEFEQALGVGDGEGSLVCCSPWGFKESDTTQWLNWTYSVMRSIFWSLLCAYVRQCFHSTPHPTLPHSTPMLARSYPFLLVLFLSILYFCCCSEWGLSFQCIFWLLFAYVKITYVLLYWILLLFVVVFSWLSCIFRVYSHIMCKE